MNLRNITLLAACLAAVSGCETVSGQQRRVAETRLQHEVASLRSDLRRLEERLADSESEREVLHTRLADIQERQQRQDRQRSAEMEALDQRLTAYALEQGRMRQELVEELGSRMATIIQSHARTTSAASTQSGYVHVVRQGETLSEIAREYRVSSAAIIQANNLENPNALRIGQELFIPE